MMQRLSLLLTQSAGILVFIFCIALNFAFASPEVKFFKAQRQESDGVFLVVHGLNLKPEKMDSLVIWLTSIGYDVMRVALSGHHGDDSEIKQVTRQKWLDDLDIAKKIAKDFSTAHSGAPIYYLGYSLGGALGLDSYLNRGGGFSKLLLLAPALSVRTPEELIRFLARQYGMGFTIPGAGHAEYRAHLGTTMAEYTALFDSISAIKQSDLSGVNIPVQVFVDLKDELVDTVDLEKKVSTFPLGQIHFLDTTGCNLKPCYHHSIIDEHVLSSSAWEELKTLILTQFLNLSY